MFRVLLVDDEPYIRQGLKILIPWKEYGFEIVSEASNGEEAITIIKKENVDLIITDIRMPLMSGLELMEYIWKNISSSVKCILLSGYYDFEYAKQAIRYEAANYILKPVEKEELIQALLEVKGQIELLEKNKEDKDTTGYIKLDSTYHLEKELLDELILEMEEQKIERLERRVEELYHIFKCRIKERNVIQLHMDYLLMNLIDLIKKISSDYKEEELKEKIVTSGFYEIAENKSIIYLKQFILEFSDYICGISQNNFGGILKEVKKEIHNNYSDGLSLKSLSEKYYINSAYLGQLFKKQYGMSFKDYLNNHRIEKAAELLRRTDSMVGEISERVGFNSTDYFISKFVEVYDITPLQYRKQFLQGGLQKV